MTEPSALQPSRRILLLITDLEIGGTPTVVRELAIRLRTPDAQIDVACLADWGPVATELHKAGVRVTSLGARSALDLAGTLSRLFDLIREREFDTVFSFLIHANTLAAIASIAFPNVRFLQSIQTTQPTPRWHWWLQRLIRPMAERVIVPSPAAAAMARHQAGFPDARIVMIPNAIDLRTYDAIFAHNRQRQITSPVQLGFIGRLDPVKRVPALIRAMPALMAAAKKREGCHLHLFGDGKERTKIEAEIKALELGRFVTLHGAVNRPYDALVGLHALLLPSIAEGFGLVLIEAMAAGVPVVAARSPGITDIITNGVNGVLFDTTEPSDIARAVEQALQESKRTGLIHAGRAEVAARYDWPAILPKYRSLLRLPKLWPANPVPELPSTATA